MWYTEATDCSMPDNKAMAYVIMTVNWIPKLNTLDANVLDCYITVIPSN